MLSCIAEKKPKKARTKAKASPTIDEEEPLKEEVHASLTVSIQLLEGAMTTVTPRSLEKDYTGKPAYSTHPVTLSLHGAHPHGRLWGFGVCMEALLSLRCD